MIDQPTRWSCDRGNIVERPGHLSEVAVDCRGCSPSFHSGVTWVIWYYTPYGLHIRETRRFKRAATMGDSAPDTWTLMYSDGC